MPSGIHFVVQGTPNAFKERRLLKAWLAEVAKAEGYQIEELNYVLMSDDDLLEYNRKYLNHDAYTDVITFDNDGSKGISGDVLMSYDRIKENARSLSVTLHNELRRVMVHGLLHLCGHNDGSKKSKAAMRLMENGYLKSYGR